MVPVNPYESPGWTRFDMRFVERRRGLGTRAKVIPGNGDLAAIVLVDHQLRVRIVLRAEVQPVPLLRSH